MLKLPIYIYETGYTLFSDLDGTVPQGYAPMYQKDIQIVKGVTNTVKFTVQNQDQKPLDISSETFTFHLVNTETGGVLLDKQCTTLDDGSTRATRGVCTLTLSESDTADLVSKFYKFSVTRTVNGAGNYPTYANTYYEVAGTMEIVDTAYASFSVSEELPNTDFTRPLTSDFYSVGGQVTEYYSSIVNARPEWKRNNPLHTIAYYTTGYTGDIVIQATQESQPDSGTSWVDLQTISLSNATGVDYVNLTGVYQNLRLYHLPDSLNAGTVDKVLVRS